MTLFNLKYWRKEFNSKIILLLFVFMFLCNGCDTSDVGSKKWVVQDTYAFTSVDLVGAKRPNTKAKLLVYFPDNDDCKTEIALMISSNNYLGKPVARQKSSRSMLLSSVNKIISGDTLVSVYEYGLDMAFKCTQEDLLIFNDPSVTVNYSDNYVPITYTTKNAKNAIDLAEKRCKSRR